MTRIFILKCGKTYQTLNSFSNVFKVASNGTVLLLFIKDSSICFTWLFFGVLYKMWINIFDSEVSIGNQTSFKMFSLNFFISIEVNILVFTSVKPKTKAWAVENSHVMQSKNRSPVTSNLSSQEYQTKICPFFYSIPLAWSDDASLIYRFKKLSTRAPGR